MQDIYTLPIIITTSAMLPNSLQWVEVTNSESKVVCTLALKNNNETFFVVTKNNENEKITVKKQLEKAGVIGKIVEISEISNGDLMIKVSTYAAAFLSEISEKASYLEGNVRKVNYSHLELQMLEFYKNELRIMISKMPSSKKRGALESIARSGDDLNFVINGLLFVLNYKDIQNFLKIENTEDRYKIVMVALALENSKAELFQYIEKKVEKEITKNQKDYLLREQVKVIKAELGEDDKEYSKLKDKIKELKASDEIKEKLNVELERLNRMSVMSQEYGVLRNYFDWVIDLPWQKFTIDNFDLHNVRAILDEDHYGLEKVKERIVEYIAVKKITNGENKAPILCFVGPPGVGKTSIAASIARATGKEYLHLSLGGIKDESEIRGHRKTYIASMPGRIITSLAKAKSSNPLFLLDEVDKMTSNMQGDPSSALLEVLDPNQNCAFRDNYLEVPYDLSQVMFIMTANSLAPIQKPLLDRMEIIELNGYTDEEKLQIAIRYLVPKQLKQNGVDNCDVIFKEDAIVKIINNYTKEAGVRELERKIEDICRKIATKIVGGDNFEYVISAENVGSYLGIKKYSMGEDVINDEIGAVNGLAWTSVGGVLMPIEVQVVPKGKGDIILTGSLGDVMKESAKIALSLVKTLTEKFDLPEDIWTKYDIHINVPEGATPKDGPSAGVTMTTAILSSITKKKVLNNLAMTGEITLRGKVLAIGGLKEKTLAGLRNGIKTIIIPKQNQKDLAELPTSVINNINFILADNIQDVFSGAFGV